MKALGNEWQWTCRDDMSGVWRYDRQLLAGILLVVRRDGDVWLANFHAPTECKELGRWHDAESAKEGADSAVGHFAPELLPQTEESPKEWRSRIVAMHNGMPETTNSFWKDVAARLAG